MEHKDVQRLERELSDERQRAELEKARATTVLTSGLAKELASMRRDINEVASTKEKYEKPKRKIARVESAKGIAEKELEVERG